MWRRFRYTFIRRFFLARNGPIFGGCFEQKGVFTGWVDYVHITKFDARQVIVNVLWHLTPNTEKSTEHVRCSGCELSNQGDAYDFIAVIRYSNELSRISW